MLKPGIYDWSIESDIYIPPHHQTNTTARNTERQSYLDTQCVIVKTNVTYQGNLIFKYEIRITQHLMEEYYAFIILCDVLCLLMR
jgi:hypothetical protein